MLLAFSIAIGKYVLDVLVLGFEVFPHSDVLRVSGLILQLSEGNSVDGEQLPLLLRNWEGDKRHNNHRPIGIPQAA
jgi:hypothetical protein